MMKVDDFTCVQDYLNDIMDRLAPLNVVDITIRVNPKDFERLDNYGTDTDVTITKPIRDLTIPNGTVMFMLRGVCVYFLYSPDK